MGTTVRQLRDDLQDLLEDRLGAYVLANGSTTPAVAVRAESEGLAAGTKVSGLELVINRHPSVDAVRQYYREESSNTWEVWLLAWDNKVEITEAAAKVIWYYPGTTAQPVGLPEGWGPRRQIRLTIPDPRDLPIVLRDVDGGDFKEALPATLKDWILDGGNFFDRSTLDTYAGTADGGVFT